MPNSDHVSEQLDAIAARLETIERALRGDMNNLGIVAKVNILWRSWVWILCTASAAIGGVTVWIIERMVS